MIFEFVVRGLPFACVALFAAVAVGQTTRPASPFDYERGVPAGEIVETKATPLHRRERVMITNPGREPIPAIVSLPAAGAAGAKPYPVVVAIHGAYVDQKERSIDRYAARLNKLGVAVVAFDLPGHGQRMADDAAGFRSSLGLLLLDLAMRSGREVPPGLKMIAGMKGNEVTPQRLKVIGQGVAQGVVDARRVIDYLQTRPDVDGSKIAAAGVSLGGLVAVLLTDADDRVAAASLSVSGGWPMLADRAGDDAEVKALFDQLDVRARAAGISPRPVLMLNGRHDQTVTRDNAQSLFDALGHPKAIRWYPAGHHLPGRAFDEAAAWLAERLKSPDKRT